VATEGLINRGRAVVAGDRAVLGMEPHAGVIDASLEPARQHDVVEPGGGRDRDMGGPAAVAVQIQRPAVQGAGENSGKLEG
jgi:hypothetical protein